MKIGKIVSGIDKSTVGRNNCSEENDFSMYTNPYCLENLGGASHFHFISLRHFLNLYHVIPFFASHQQHDFKLTNKSEAICLFFLSFIRVAISKLFFFFFQVAR